MRLVMYLFYDLAPLYVLLPLMISEHLLRSFDPLNLRPHRQMLLYQFLLLQITQSLIYLQILLLLQAFQLRPLAFSLS
jgi:hypothetical protein